MKHTPGPWKAYTCDFIGTDEEDYQTIAYTSDHRNRKRRPREETHANALLIARAPELEHLARDIVALLFWRWRSAKRDKSGYAIHYEVEAEGAFWSAYDFMKDKEDNDQD